MRTSGELRAALLLPQEAQFTGQLPDVFDRDRHAENGPGSQTGTRSRRETSDQLDGASANLLRPGYRRQYGGADKFAAGKGMPAGRDGVFAHQSSARLSHLRSSWRMPFAGIQRRLRDGGIAFSRK